MTGRHWRGTIVYAGSVLALGAAALARYGGVPGLAGDGSAPSGAPAVVAGSEPVTPATPTPAPSTAGSTAPGTSPASPGTGTPDPTRATVTGSVVQTRYGPVQVAVRFTGTHLDAVQTVRSPSGGESSQISARATPLLAQEAVRAQSARIDTVSGATYTSEGYRESLQAAIDARG